jgi:hypothetical protein
MATRKAYLHLGLKAPARAGGGELFGPGQDEGG